MAEPARIVFRRRGGYADMLRGYRIEVDGQEVGLIRRKSSFEIEVEPGTVEIGARIDWCRAEPLVLELAAGAVARIEVINTHGAQRAGYAITAGADNYLTLIEETDP